MDEQPDWAYDEATHKFTRQIGPCAVSVWQDTTGLWAGAVMYGKRSIMHIGFSSRGEAEAWAEREAKKMNTRKQR